MPCDSMVGFGLTAGTSPAKTTLPFLAARVVPASSSSAGELGRMFFLGGIVWLVFVTQTTSAKCWVPTHGQVGLNTQRQRQGTLKHDKTLGENCNVSLCVSRPATSPGVANPKYGLTLGHQLHPRNIPRNGVITISCSQQAAHNN